MSSEHTPHLEPPPQSRHLEDRIMQAVRATPPPKTRGAIRARQSAWIGGGTLAVAAAVLIAATVWFDNPAPEPTLLPTTDSPAPALIALGSAPLWQMPTADVSALATAMDGASTEATRTVLSLLDQAGSGLRVFRVTTEVDEASDDRRSETMPESTRSQPA